MSKIDLSQYITTKEAAEMMGLHRRYVRTLVLQGRVTSVKFGKNYLISRASAQAFKRDPLGRGRPKAKAKKPFRAKKRS